MVWEIQQNRTQTVLVYKKRTSTVPVPVLKSVLPNPAETYENQVSSLKSGPCILRTDAM